MFTFRNETLVEKVRVFKNFFSKNSDILETIHQKSFEIDTQNNVEGLNTNFTLVIEKGNNSPKEFIPWKQKSIFAKNVLGDGVKGLAMFEKNFMEKKGNKIIF